MLALSLEGVIRVESIVFKMYTANVFLSFLFFLKKKKNGMTAFPGKGYKFHAKSSRQRWQAFKCSPSIVIC
jgi:hypothetical protein